MQINSNVLDLHSFNLKKMKVFNTRKELEIFRNSINTDEISIGFVPTMGALHDGHA